MSAAQKAFDKRKARLAREREKEVEEYEASTVEYRRGLTHDEKARMFKLTYREPWPFEEAISSRDNLHLAQELGPYAICCECGAYRNQDTDEVGPCEGYDYCQECWNDLVDEHGDAEAVMAWLYPERPSAEWSDDDA